MIWSHSLTEESVHIREWRMDGLKIKRTKHKHQLLLQTAEVKYKLSFVAESLFVGPKVVQFLGLGALFSEATLHMMLPGNGGQTVGCSVDNLTPGWTEQSFEADEDLLWADRSW